MVSLSCRATLEYLSLSSHTDVAAWKQGEKIITEHPCKESGSALASDITLLSFWESTSHSESTLSNVVPRFNTPGFVSYVK